MVITRQQFEQCNFDICVDLRLLINATKLGSVIMHACWQTLLIYFKCVYGITQVVQC